MNEIPPRARISPTPFPGAAPLEYHELAHWTIALPSGKRSSYLLPYHDCREETMNGQVGLPYGTPPSDVFRVGFVLSATPSGISRLTLRRPADQAPTPDGSRVGAVIVKARLELAEYLSGRRSYFSIPVDLSRVPGFDRAALQLAAAIPYGEVRSYKWIAEQLGRPDAARAVGSAMAGNPVPILIPCHRVVKTDGGLGGYLFGLEFKQALLDLEGSILPFVGCIASLIVCRRGCAQEQPITETGKIPFRTLADAQTKGYRPCPACMQPGPLALPQSTIPAAPPIGLVDSSPGLDLDSTV
jgi:methylated-DNA-[protein]-cysteine S-methyltransferase